MGQVCSQPRTSSFTGKDRVDGHSTACKEAQLSNQRRVEQAEADGSQKAGQSMLRDSVDDLQRSGITEKAEDEQKGSDVEHRSDSAYLPRVQPLEDMSPISDEDSQRNSVQGLPYETVNLGPPKPPCNDDRIATLRALDLADRAPDPELEHIIQLACTVFGTNNALVALLDSERIIIRNCSGMFAPGDFPWRYSFCGYTLASQNPTTMVIEDSHKDARFKHNPFVNGDPPVRFYCGTPLIASNGHRLGTLCFADPEPHHFDAERCNILNNMAELCVREIEREHMLRLQQQQLKDDYMMNAGMKRALEAFQEAILMVDTTAEGWKVLHVNSAFVSQTGLGRKEVADSAFWDIFKLKSSAALPEAIQETARLNKEFTISGVCLASWHHSDTSDDSAAAGRLFSMGFRPANHDQLDDNTLAIGVPSYMPSSAASGKGLYFVSMHGMSVLSIASTRSALSDCFIREPPFEGLEIGTLLGKGGYGSVYRGSYKGERCAVKIIEDLSVMSMRDGKPLEAVITEGMQHPHIVNTIAHTIVTVQSGRNSYTHDSAASSSLGASSGAYRGGSGSCGAETKQNVGGSSSHSSGSSKRSRHVEQVGWLLLEFCDRGCLQEAIDKGWLRSERTLMTADGCPKMATVLAVAKEVAEGMAFLHAHDVVHGDLTGGNVLLAASESQPHGFSAKVADFGLARNLDICSKVETKTYGTITHMPLELLRDGIMSKAADVYAFGVLLWEMIAGCRAWASMKHAQVMHNIVVEHRSLKFPSYTPADYLQLAQRCLSHEASMRPTFQEAIAELSAMQAARSGNKFQPAAAASLDNGQT